MKQSTLFALVCNLTFHIDIRKNVQLAANRMEKFENVYESLLGLKLEHAKSGIGCVLKAYLYIIPVMSNERHCVLKHRQFDYLFDS